MKKAVSKKMGVKVGKTVANSKKAAVQEVAKVKRMFDTNLKQFETYVGKHPEKAALIAAGIGAALVAIPALFMGAKKKAKKR